MTSWLTTRLGDRHFPIIMVDGVHMGDHFVLIALGIDFEGKKQVLGLREGDTENGQVVRSLLRDLLDRGLDQERARLFVIDGAKALTSAIQKTFGPLAEIQRCRIHIRRNILGHLPDSGIVTDSRNVKRWQGGTMVVRWASAAIVEAEKKFRRVKGWRDIEKLIRALEAKEQKQEAIAKCVA